MRTELSAPLSLRGALVMPDARYCREELPRKGLLANGLTKTDAESLLDCLEAHGRVNCRVSYVGGEGFAITV
jgi:hypothetical protein